MALDERLKQAEKMLRQYYHGHLVTNQKQSFAANASCLCVICADAKSYFVAYPDSAPRSPTIAEYDNA